MRRREVLPTVPPGLGSDGAGKFGFGTSFDKEMNELPMESAALRCDLAGIRV